MHRYNQQVPLFDEDEIIKIQKNIQKFNENEFIGGGFIATSTYIDVERLQELVDILSARSEMTEEYLKKLFKKNKKLKKRVKHLEHRISGRIHRLSS